MSERSGVAASRIAATGATFAARRAGSSAETAVTRMPTTKATMTVRGCSTIGADGRPAPKAPNSACRPSATPIPAASPIADARPPTTTASISTERVTWPLLAPSARIRASSRVRCATRIENVLKMMKAPTNSATAAKTSRKVFRKPRPSWMSLACSSASWVPVIASVPAGIAAATRSRSSSCPTPSRAATSRSL